MTKPRLPRFERARDPPPMVLTRRDWEIVKAVRSFRLLTRSQIETLLFPPDKGQDHPTKTSRCRLRLKLLYHHGFLERPLASVQPGPARGDFVYCLDRKGAELIAREEGIEVNWRPKDKKLSPFFLQHTLRVNDFRIAVTLAAKQRGWALLEWVDEKRLKAMEERVPDPSQPGKTLPFVPDGFFALEVGEKRACFFLEVDRGTMPTNRFQTKVRAYLSFRQSGAAMERFKTRNFRVLTVTPGKKRLTSLWKATEKAGGGHHFWFTTFSQVTPEGMLTLPIWQVIGLEGLHLLVEGDDDGTES